MAPHLFPCFRCRPCLCDGKAISHGLRGREAPGGPEGHDEGRL